MLSFKPTFSLSSFTFIKRLFSSSLHPGSRGHLLQEVVPNTEFEFPSVLASESQKIEDERIFKSQSWPYKPNPEKVRDYQPNATHLSGALVRFTVYP